MELPLVSRAHPALRVDGVAWRRARVVAVKAAAVALLVYAGLRTLTHQVAGVSWPDVLMVLSQVAPGQLLVIGAIWFGGLCVYTVVLGAALPGLGPARSLLLNLSGSAVSNVLPFGGAAGTALNWRMVTRWGHTNSAFVAFCLLTNGLDVLTKLLLPLLALAGLASATHHVSPGMWTLAASCSAALVGVLGIGFLLPVLARRSPRLRRRFALVEQVQQCGERITDLVRGGWRRMLAGSLGYAVAHVALLDVCLHAVGLHPSLSVVAMAAAIERLGTIVAITPGGVGVAELGAVAWLMGAGLDPLGVVAGVVLCRVFLVLIEIPVGGVLLAGYLARHRNRGRRADVMAA